MKLTLRALMTESCDLSCRFCHNEGQPAGSRFMDLPLEYFVRLLEILLTMGLRRVKFSGGEPTLHQNLSEYIAASESLGSLDLALISNGQNRGRLEALAARHPGLRFSLNLPTLEPVEYARMTGGSLGGVLSSLAFLSQARRDVSLNVYCPSNVSATSLSRMIDFAGVSGFKLKLLTPCQLATKAQQANHAVTISQKLSKLGFLASKQADYSREFYGVDFAVRVVEPWCPGHCAKLRQDYVTLRLTAAADIRPCFRSDNSSYSLSRVDPSDWPPLLENAILESGGACSVSSNRVQVVSRS